jgi:HK97 family phage major capsid protein
MTVLSRDQIRERRNETQGEEQRLRTQRDQLLARAQADNALTDPGVVEKLNRLQAGIDRAHEQYEEAARAFIEDAAQDPRNREAGAEFQGSRDQRTDDQPIESRAPRLHRDAAMRTIERHINQGALTSEAADRVDGVLRGGDAELGVDAQYIEAAGDEAYARAFAKLLRYGDGAVLRMTPQEQTAVQKTNRVEELRTAMTVGSGSGGGFAIPIGIDPTINLSSSGSINPIRQLADVRTMSTRELRLVTADSFVAQYQAEAAEAIDNSPVLAQPTLIAQRATSFVPFSFEVDQDWASVSQELAKGISDAKDVLEATKFLLGAGSGSNEPVGLLTIGTAGALTTTQRVQTTGAGAIAVGDVYALKAALGQTRFAASASWTMNPTRLDAVYRLTPSGSTTEPQIMDSRNGDLLGRPVYEWSTMATATTTTKWAIYGDFKQGYVIGDRLGMSLEIIPHLFGATSRYPTGQRGAYAIWRNDGRCKVLNALRYGEVL